MRVAGAGLFCRTLLIIEVGAAGIRAPDQ